jgi:hypothetical protein
MSSIAIFIACIVWAVSYLGLPKLSLHYVNLVQRLNFGTINAILVLVLYMVTQYERI